MRGKKHQFQAKLLKAVFKPWSFFLHLGGVVMTAVMLLHLGVRHIQSIDIHA